MSLTDKLGNLPEIDLEQGLGRVGGNEAIYLRLLSKLAPMIDKSIAGLDLAQSKPDLEAIAFEAHSVKGAMYNLGVTAIGDAARDLEQLARAGNAEKTAESTGPFLNIIKDFKTRLTKTLD